MYKKFKYITTIVLVACGFLAQAQSTTSSPYSSYGFGNLSGSLLPQMRAMGGISTGVNKFSSFNHINMQNPATYSNINLTTLDLGVRFGNTTLKRDNQSESSKNGSFNHLVFAIPVTKKSAMSFGLMPYSNMGYSFKNPVSLDTVGASHLFKGEGGLSKAYLGYGTKVFKRLSIGANVEYLFGNLEKSRALEMVEVGSFNTKMTDKSSIGGFKYSYGLQYDFNISEKTLVTLGYSGSSSSKVSSLRTILATQYTRTAAGEESSPIDTLNIVTNAKTNINMPLNHNFGLSIQQLDKWMIGADFRTGKWSNVKSNGANLNLQDSYGVSVGGQITPDINSYNNYFKRMDYRFGVRYDKTFIQINNQDIKEKSVSFGFGFPLAAAQGGVSFYKINFTTEIGRRGALGNGLVQENFVNFHLGFTLNDTWFRRYRVD